MQAKLVKIDKNGSKHFEGYIKCDRCGGDGIYKWGAVINGVPQYAGTCFKCLGAGVVLGKWIERTPEYQAKLDAKREAKWLETQARINAERLEREAREKAEREAREAQIRAQKAISQHVGSVGERIEIKGTYVKSGSWEQKAFGGFNIETMYAHTFKDTDGNVFVWKTSKNISFEYGEPVILKGTVKEHSEYKDEKQTVLTRCKVEGGSK
jgi:hypothetical protein